MSDPTPPLPPVINYASPGVVPPPRRFGRGLFGWVLFIGLAVMLFLVLQSKPFSGQNLSLSEFSAQLASGNVREVVIDGETLRGTFVKPIPWPSATGATAFRTELPQGTSQSWVFVQWLLDHREGANVRVENNQSLLVNLLLPLVPWLLIFAFIWFFVFRLLRKNAAQLSQAKPMPVYIVNPENK